MTWILVGTVGMVGVGLLWYLGSKPARHRGRSTANLLSFLTSFELGGREGGLLFIEHEGSDRFLQFVHAGSLRPERPLSLGFPEVAWSQPYFGAVRAAILARGYPLVERTGSDGTRFLDVEPLNVPEAVGVAEAVLEAMGLGDGARYTMHFAGPVSTPAQGPFNVRIREHGAALGRRQSRASEGLKQG